MLEAFPKAAFSLLAGSHGLERLASRHGLRRPDGFARRFIAGETVDEAIETARAIEASGLRVTLDHLGESVSTRDAAADATKVYVGIIAALAESGIGHNVSIKLTQLGLDIDRATSIDNVRRVLDAAAPVNIFVRLDMERSTHTELTLDAFETLWSIGYRNAGVVIQSCLRRSAADVDRMIALGARIRLVKGACSDGLMR